MPVTHSEWGEAIRAIHEEDVVIAIGDVHGRADLLAELHIALERELARLSPRTAYCIHLGDLIDRGPQSRAAMDLARNGLSGARSQTILGNHEDRLLKLLQEPNEEMLNRWLLNGGEEFFQELDISPHADWRSQIRDALGDEIVTWLRTLPSMFRLGQLLFVHAGIDINVPIKAQAMKDLTWIREPWLSSTGPYEDGVAVMHGHTPIDKVDVSNRHRLNLDTGACETGVLSALLISGSKMKVINTLPCWWTESRV